MSSAASGVATSPLQQQQLPPLKQIRFVNNEGQPPAKRRRINAACVLSLFSLDFCGVCCVFCARRRSSQITYSEVPLLTDGDLQSNRCRTCRKRKTRCDGKKPLCSTCTENGHECLGYADVVRELRRRNEKIAMLGLRRSITRMMTARNRR
jgi:hypothetical protein